MEYTIFKTHHGCSLRCRQAASVMAQTGDIKLAKVQLSHTRVAHDFGPLRSQNENHLKKAAEALAGTVQKFLPTNLPTN